MKNSERGLLLVVLVLITGLYVVWHKGSDSTSTDGFLSVGNSPVSESEREPSSRRVATAEEYAATSAKGVGVLEDHLSSLSEEDSSSQTRLASEFESTNVEEEQFAWNLGFEKISSLDPSSIRRWRLVSVASDSFVPDEEAKYPQSGRFDISRQVTLGFFPDAEINADLSKVIVDKKYGSYLWVGSATSSTDSTQQGRIEISAIRNPDTNMVEIFAHYSDRFQDFHISPIYGTPYYLAVETERGASATKVTD